MNEYFPVVVQVVKGTDHLIYVYFSDGTIHLFDAEALLAKGGVFEKLRDERFFAERMTVLNDTLAWDVGGNFDPRRCIDIDPVVLYKTPVVSDPLSETA